MVTTVVAPVMFRVMIPVVVAAVMPVIVLAVGTMVTTGGVTTVSSWLMVDARGHSGKTEAFYSPWSADLSQFSPLSPPRGCMRAPWRGDFPTGKG